MKAAAQEVFFSSRRTGKTYTATLQDLQACPGRIQIQREKGWRKPPGMLACTRGTRWGNPFRIGDFPHQSTARLWGWDRLDINLIATDEHEAVTLFAAQLLAHPQSIDAVRGLLGGRLLGCRCAVGEPCHADLLLTVANASTKAKAIAELEAAR